MNREELLTLAELWDAEVWLLTEEMYRFPWRYDEHDVAELEYAKEEAERYWGLWEDTFEGEDENPELSLDDVCYIGANIGQAEV